MQTATRLLATACLLLWGGAAFAQSNITFQVDLNPAINTCNFTPDTDDVFVRGSFNDWGNGGDGELSEYALNDAGEDGDATAEDGVYTGTFEVVDDDLDDSNNIAYKFYAEPGPLGWEDDPNTTFEVTGDATIPAAEFRKADLTDQCGVETDVYDITFQVDMSVADLLPGVDFNPDEDVVVVAGTFQEDEFSNATADTLRANFFNPDIYEVTVTSAEIAAGEQEYKYIIGEPEDMAPDGWEGGGNRTFTITGDEADTDNNGNPNVVVDTRFFNDVGPDDILDAEATVVFEVDLRPAYYFLADSTFLPGDLQEGGDVVTAVSDVYINGPVAGSADGLTDWADWAPDQLGAIDSRELVDDGSDGDAAAGDSIFTVSYTYPAGAQRELAGKFSVGGYDNEGGFGADHIFQIAAGTQNVRVIFGCIEGADGTFDDDTGPPLAGADEAFPQYDPYLQINADGSSCVVVRRGGEADANEVGIEDRGGVLPTAAVLEAAYPNPFARTTLIEYSVPVAGAVSLTVYDVTGRVVATLVDEVQAASNYRVSFDAADLASGVYVYQLRTADAVVSKRVTLIR